MRSGRNSSHDGHPEQDGSGNLRKSGSETLHDDMVPRQFHPVFNIWVNESCRLFDWSFNEQL
jgi:hypothetical protein